MLEDYLEILDDMTSQERDIFLYCFILKVTQQGTAKRLKLSCTTVNRIYHNIKKTNELLNVKAEVLRAFSICN